MTVSPAAVRSSLSSWWKVAATAAMGIGFGVLILLTVKAYQNAPPIPAKVVDPAGIVLFTSDDVAAGQQVFQPETLAIEHLDRMPRNPV
jgi:nitric oxide reductase subunit B